MAFSKTYVDIDLSPGGIKPRLNAKQGDVGRPFVFNLYWSGEAFDASSYTAQIRILKPDDYICLDGGTISKTTVTWKTSEQDTAVNGTCKGELVIADANGIVASQTFSFIVEQNLLEDATASDSDLSALTDALNEATETAAKATASATAAAESEANAKTYAKESEAWARGTIDGKDVGTDADQYQNNAKYYADQVKDAIDTVEESFAEYVGEGIDAAGKSRLYKRELTLQERWSFMMQGDNVSRQGFTMSDEKAYQAVMGSSNDDYAEFYVIDIDSDEVTFVQNNDVTGHCNALSYDSKNDVILCVSNSGTTGWVLNTDASLNTTTTLPQVTYALAYDAVNDRYLMRGSGTVVAYTWDKDSDTWTATGDSFTVFGDQTQQSLCVDDNGFIYICDYESTSTTYQPEVHEGVQSTGWIRMYTSDGTMLRTWMLSDKYGEIEDMEVKEGILYVSYGPEAGNTGNGTISCIYTSVLRDDVPNGSWKLEDKMVANWGGVAGSTLDFYIDEDYEGATSRGTKAQPFKRWSELLFFMRNVAPSSARRVYVYISGNVGTILWMSPIPLLLYASDETATAGGSTAQFFSCTNLYVKGVTFSGYSDTDSGVVIQGCNARFDGCTFQFTSGCGSQNISITNSQVGFQNSASFTISGSTAPSQLIYAISSVVHMPITPVRASALKSVKTFYYSYSNVYGNAKGGLELRSGAISTSLPPGAYTDYTVTFDHPMIGTPAVFITQLTNSTSYEDHANIAYSYHSASNTGFKIRCFNNGESSRSPYLTWMAVYGLS